MNIETMVNKVRNMIVDKEAMLAVYSEKQIFSVYPKTLEYKGICDTLVINIAELKRILENVEQCIGVEE